MKSVSLCFAGVLSLMPGLSPAEPAIPPDELRPGDLLFFWISDKGRHVGVYLEDGVFFHASTTAGVTLSKLNEENWRYRLISVRRVKHRISLQELRQDFGRYDSAGYRYGAPARSSSTARGTSGGSSATTASTFRERPGRKSAPARLLSVGEISCYAPPAV